MSAWTIAGGILLAWLLMLVIVLVLSGVTAAAVQAEPMLADRPPGATG